MGYVYRARDLNFTAIRLVAVKEMISQVPDQLVRETIFKSFEREANILATLRHPSVPRIYDYFTKDNRAYLILEFINGSDLGDILDDQTVIFPEDQVITWAIELCDVLEYLHSHEPEPITFRDMKPSNIMVTPQNHIVLIDYNIAKVFQANVAKHTMVGTEGYSPPEQYRGEANPLVDIYALGATLHHILTLQDPRLETPFTFPERPIRQFNDNISPELDAVVFTAVQYDPEDRFQSAGEMKDALVNVARKTGVLGSVSMPTAAFATPGGVKPLWTFKCEDEIRGTPNIHEGVLFIGSYDNNLYALDASNGEFSWKYATDGGIPGRPAIYDGNIFFGSEDNRLHVISARSGSVVWTYYTEAPVRSSPRIAQGHVFVGSDDAYLHAINLNTGRAVWQVEIGSPVRSTPFVTNEFAYVGSESGEVFCVDFRGEVKWRFKAKRAVTSSPVVVDGTVYFSSLDSTVYSVDAMGGWANWRFRLGRGSISTPYIVDNLLFVGSIDNNVYGVDIRSSKEAWRFSTDHQVTGSPVVYKDSVYIGSVDGFLYCLEHNNGRLRWKFQTEGPITGTPVVYDDIVYVGSTDNHIYALLA